ncbi:hypothetical protein RP20_CCG011368 [Aedes albopictus]|nr:hypothetical protein RP20_CCG011368 [Aedes albopictus]
MMEPLVSRKQQRARETRDAKRQYYTFRDPWGAEYQLRNKTPRRGLDPSYGEPEDRCCYLCGCFGRFLLLLVAVGAVWYTWTRVAAASEKLAMNFPTLSRPCATPEATSTIQVTNCTLIQLGLFIESLAQLLLQM